MKVYTTPSGMGGIFTVRIIETVTPGVVRVRIYMPKNPDFHGYEFTTREDQLTPEGVLTDDTEN